MVVVLLLVLLSAAACASPATPAASSPDVWAVVNGTEIHRDRVDRFYRTMVAANGGTPTDEEAIGAKLGLLDELINNEILLEHARTLSIAPADDELEKAIAERRGPLSDADFAKQLDERHVTAGEFRTEVRRELTVQALVEREVTSKVTVTDEEVAAFFEKNRAQFNLTERQYHLAQIVVNAAPNPQVNNRRNDDARTPEEANRKLNMLAERLRAGDSFASLAADFSEDPPSAAQGGDLGLVGQSAIDQAPPDLRRAVVQMKPGELSTITSGGVATILALVRRQEPGQRDLSDPEVKEGIRSALKERRLQLLQGAFMTRMRNEATVVNYLARQIVDAQGKLPDAAQVR